MRKDRREKLSCFALGYVARTPQANRERVMAVRCDRLRSFKQNAQELYMAFTTESDKRCDDVHFEEKALTTHCEVRATIEATIASTIGWKNRVGPLENLRPNSLSDLTSPQSTNHGRTNHIGHHDRHPVGWPSEGTHTSLEYHDSSSLVAATYMTLLYHPIHMTISPTQCRLMYIVCTLNSIKIVAGGNETVKGHRRGE